MRAMEKRRIVIPLFPGTEILDVTGPVSVLHNATGTSRGRLAYEIVLAAHAEGPVATSSGVALHATATLAKAPRAIDTLLVPGGEGTEAAARDPAYVGALKRLAPRAKRVASVCSGAFLLAEAGLLDGLAATTHWRHAGRLARTYPRVKVEPDAIYVEAGRVWTSAGVTAGLDLALALVERDGGRELALEVARGLVFYLKRPGGQSQFSVPLATQAADRPAIERVRQHVIEHPQADLSLAALAERAHVSERHLRRLFRSALDLSPRAFVQETRLEHAQRLLCDSRHGVREIARRCGYASPESFARRFERRYGVSPTAYRARFRRPAGDGTPPR